MEERVMLALNLEGRDLRILSRVASCTDLFNMFFGKGPDGPIISVSFEHKGKRQEITVAIETVSGIRPALDLIGRALSAWDEQT